LEFKFQIKQKKSFLLNGLFESVVLGWWISFTCCVCVGLYSWILIIRHGDLNKFKFQSKQKKVLLNGLFESVVLGSRD